MDSARRAAACAVLLLACGRDHRSLLDELPPDTWAAAHLDATSDAMHARWSVAQVLAANACRVDVIGGLRSIDVALTPSTLVVEVTGDIDEERARCLAVGLVRAGDIRAQVLGDRLRLTARIDAGRRGALSAPMREAFAREAVRSSIAVTAMVDDPTFGVVYREGRLSLWTPDVHVSEEISVRADVALQEVPGMAPTVLDGNFVHVTLPSAMTQVASIVALRQHVMEMARVPGSSMSPSLLPGDHVFIFKGSLAGELERGDVVVCRAGGRETYMRRVVGVPHDHARIVHGELHIDHVDVVTRRLGVTTIQDQPPRIDELWEEQVDGQRYLVARAPGTRGRTTERVAGDDQYIVASDNRDREYHDLVPAADIVGRAVLILYSANTSGIRWDRVGIWFGRP